jgi:predicted MFS family arabinose efflux permease
VIRLVANAYRAAFAGLPRDVWIVSSVALVNRAGTMVLPFLTLYLTYERGLTPVEAGRVLSLFGIGSVAGSVVGGWLSDRLGPFRAQQISLIASGAGFLVLGTLERTPAISVAVLGLSVVSEAFRPAVMAACAEVAPVEVRARAFALLRLAVNLGLGIGPAVGGLLALRAYFWLFVGDALTCWLAAALLVVARPARRAAARPEPAAGAGGGPSPRSPWSDRPFLLLMLLVVVLATAFFQILSTLPLHLRQVYGFREDAVGMLLAFNPALIVLFEMVLIHAVERRRPLPLIGLGSFLVCAGFALMPFGSSLAFAALTILIWSAGEMLALPLINAVVAERAGGGRRGRYMGLYTMAFSVAFVFAPAGGTWVYDNLGPDRLWFGVGLLGPLLWLGALALSGPLAPRKTT